MSRQSSHLQVLGLHLQLRHFLDTTQVCFALQLFHLGTWLPIGVVKSFLFTFLFVMSRESSHLNIIWLRLQLTQLLDTTQVCLTFYLLLLGTCLPFRVVKSFFLTYRYVMSRESSHLSILWLSLNLSHLLDTNQVVLTPYLFNLGTWLKFLFIKPFFVIFWQLMS